SDVGVPPRGSHQDRPRPVRAAPCHRFANISFETHTTREERDKLTLIADSALLLQLRRVKSDGCVCNTQLAGHLLRRDAGNEELKHVPLPEREPEHAAELLYLDKRLVCSSDCNRGPPSCALSWLAPAGTFTSSPAFDLSIRQPLGS